MATLVLVRHGRSTANTSGVLAGRAGGVRLDAVGKDQAARVAGRLARVPLVAVVSSPLQRCRETAGAVIAAQPGPPTLQIERALNECDYGDWQGRSLRELTKEKLWRVVQQQPSAAGFPGGETLAQMQSRAVDAVRRLDRAVTEQHGPGAVWVAVSHGDVIKAVLADALGLHLDLFQRIQVDPASASMVRFGDERPHVLGVNTHEGDLHWLAQRPRRGRAAKATDVGGGAGPEPARHAGGAA